MLKQIKELQKKLKFNKIYAFIAFDKANIQYLTGNDIEGEYWLLITLNNVWIITPKMLYSQFIHLFSNSSYYKIYQSEKLFDGLKDLIRNAKIKSVGLDPLLVSIDLYEKLRNKLKDIKIKKLAKFITSLRQIKTNKELGLIKHSCEIASRVMNTVKRTLKPGLAETDIVKNILQLFYSYNAEPAFEPIVASGINSSYPHHISSKRKIQKDDIVLIDLGAKYKGYCSDLTRTIFLGRINKKFRQVYDAVMSAYNKSVRAIRDGIKAKFIDKIARDSALKHSTDFNAEYLHGSGHSIGLEVHELPRLTKYDNTILKAGMVVTVEPGLYLKNSFGVRYENTIVVTKTGCEVLTKD